MIKSVIFDLDGTLLDTTEGVLESVKHAVIEMGFSLPPYESLLKFVGPPIQTSFMNYFGCDKIQAQKAAEFFRDYYKNVALLKASPYAGIYDLCDQLHQRGIATAVATYKREDYALTLLKHFGFDKYCDSMHGADNHNVLTKADIVNICLKETHTEAKNAVLVGDTIHDAIGAENARIDFIAVTYGFGFKKPEDVENHKCIGVANTPLEVLNVLASLL